MAERNARWSFPVTGWVQLGQEKVPPKVTLDGEGLRGAPDLHAEFEIRDGVPEVTAFHMTSKPNGRGIRTADLRVFNLDGLAFNAFSRHVSPDQEERHRAGRAVDRARAGRSGVSVAELEEVARVYRENATGQPRAAVEALGYQPRTASRRIKQAEEAGLLPATRQGKRRS